MPQAFAALNPKDISQSPNLTLNWIQMRELHLCVIFSL